MHAQATILITAKKAFIAPAGTDEAVGSSDLIELDISPGLLADPDEMLTRIAERLGGDLRDRFPDGLNCRLVIPADWCFIQPIEMPSARWSADAVAYGIEEFLPEHSESLTTTYTKIGERRVLAVAVGTDPIRAFLVELEGYGVDVEAILVDVCVVAGTNDRADDAETGPILIIDETRMTLGVFGETRDHLESAITLRIPRGAEKGTGIGAALSQLRILVSTLGYPVGRCRVYMLGDIDDASRIHDLLNSQGAEAAIVDPMESVAEMVHGAQANPEGIDLRCGELAFQGRYRRTWTGAVRCAVAVFLCLVVVAIGKHGSARAYERATNRLAPIRAQLYQRVFPGGRPGPGAALKVRSERIKLEGMTKNAYNGESALVGSKTQPLDLMARVVAAIPPDIKLDLTEIQADQDGIKLIGRTKTHGDAGRLVQSLNRRPDLEAEPPMTKLRDDKTVEFRIQAGHLDNENHN